MIVEKPVILWLPADARNINVRDPNVFFEALVVHTTAGGSTIEGLGRWFGGENIRQGLFGSTHFGAGQDGRLSQHVRLDQRPIAHGAESGSRARLAIENAGKASANDWAIGCETLDGGVPGSCTDLQFTAIVRLFAWLWQTEIAPHADVTDATLDRDHILRHSELAPTSKPACPSWPEARMVRLIDEMRALLADAPPVDPRDERIRQLDAKVTGFRDDYTASVGSLDALALAGRTITAQAEEAARSARKSIAKHGA